MMKQLNFNPHCKKIYSTELSCQEQLEIIKELHKNIDTSHPCNEILSLLKKKYSSYKSQDKQSHKYDVDQHITLKEMIEKIYTSNLKCYYCNCDLTILYNKKREKTQWTLERFDNNLGHYTSNTCICCLDCNLRRRTDNHEYFKQSKQTRIIKIE